MKLDEDSLGLKSLNCYDGDGGVEGTVVVYTSHRSSVHDDALVIENLIFYISQLLELCDLMGV